MTITQTTLISILLFLNLLVSTTISQVQPKQTAKTTTQIITIADNNKMLRVNTGTNLVIQLEENPSTGYG